MRTLAFAVLASASMLAVPALAQSNTAPSANTPPSSGTSSAQTGTSPGTMSPQQVVQLRKRIKSELKQDGFSNIYVVPDSFLVRAKNRQGEPVVMIINPHSVFSLTQISAAGTTGSNGTGSSGAALGNGGTSTPNQHHSSH